ncbi:MAG: hypothetical protein ACREPV_01355 [Lysobacter sp.]
MIGVEQGTDLLEVARATGLRQHLHGVSATDARVMLGRFVTALSIPQVSGGGELVERLRALLPELEFSRGTHVEWRDCDQKYRDQNPRIGDAAFHAQCVRDYDERIACIHEAIAALSTPQARPDGGAVVEKPCKECGAPVHAWANDADPICLGCYADTHPAPAPDVALEVPYQECYADTDGDTWFDSPDDAEFTQGRKVGDTYEVRVSHYSIQRTYVVTKAPDDTSDDYEVQPFTATQQEADR